MGSLDDGSPPRGNTMSLISSDGISFEVSGTRLTEASEVFTSLLNQNTSPTELQLADTKLERATIVRLMLDLIEDRPLFPYPASLWHYRDLVLLLQKYECDMTLIKLKSILRKVSSDQTTGKIFIFLAAAQLPSIDICVSAIRNGGQQSWIEVLKQVDDQTEEEVDIGRDMRGSSSFDLTAASEAVLVRIPGKYLTALWKAQMGMDTGVDSEDWGLIAERFRKEVTGT